MAERCSCCNRECTPENRWDGLYSSCSDCAFEHSLEHFPCDHGAASAREALLDAAENVVAQWRGDISRKPYIGRLRDAIAKVRALPKESEVSAAPKPPTPGG